MPIFKQIFEVCEVDIVHKSGSRVTFRGLIPVVIICSMIGVAAYFAVVVRFWP